jgi:hypothetical protein
MKEQLMSKMQGPQNMILWEKIVLDQLDLMNQLHHLTQDEFCKILILNLIKEVEDKLNSKAYQTVKGRERIGRIAQECLYWSDQ